jgi:cell division inhibitor SepF
MWKTWKHLLLREWWIFLSGAVYCLDGDIQKISSGIFLATPASIEITGDLKDEMRNKGVFSWVK